MTVKATSGKILILIIASHYTALPHEIRRFFGMKYNYYHKIRQLFVYLKPRDKSRYGECRRCGACCKFMADCIFLKYDGEGKAVCRIQKFKFYTCTKYPLNKKEHHTRDVCGYKFPDDSK